MYICLVVLTTPVVQSGYKGGTTARYSEHDTSKIYETAQNFRDNCLLRDGSLVFDGAALWKTDLLERIHTAFVATPD